jgi:hypothetical protein
MGWSRMKSVFKLALRPLVAVVVLGFGGYGDGMVYIRFRARNTKLYYFIMYTNNSKKTVVKKTSFLSKTFTPSTNNNCHHLQSIGRNDVINR